MTRWGRDKNRWWKNSFDTEPWKNTNFHYKIRKTSLTLATQDTPASHAEVGQLQTIIASNRICRPLGSHVRASYASGEDKIKLKQKLVPQKSSLARNLITPCYDCVPL